MSDKFTFTDKHKRNLILLSVAGAVLLILGYVLSNVQLGHGGHGGGHGDAHGTKTETAHDGGHGNGGHDAKPADNHGGNTHADDTHAGAPEDTTHHANAGHATPADSTVDSSMTALMAEVKTNPEEVYPTLTKADSSEVWHLAFPDRAYLYPGNIHGVHHEHVEIGPMHKFGGALLMAGWFFLGVAVFGIFFIAFSYTSNAGWFVALKRVPEAFYIWLPIAAVVILIVYFAFGDQVWAHWKGTPEGVDSLVDGKRGFLNTGFFLFSAIGVVGIWFFFGHMLRQSSLKEDSVGGLEEFQRRRKLSILFLPLFAVPFCILAFQWMMSIETHWFSTMYGVYMFAGVFISGMTVVMLVTVNLKEKGYLAEVSMEHIHDIGKFIFAFSVFWGYIFVGQFLLIWYANMPEETTYYRLRYDNHKFLFFFNIAINFLFPFFVLMTRNAKRQFTTLKIVGIVVLLGRFTDLYLAVTPGVMQGESGAGYYFMCAGMLMVFAGPFLYLVFNNISKAPLVAKNHPYLEESIHHNTGV